MDEIRITPRCINGENIFISSEGWLLPCCYSHVHLRRVMANPAKYNKQDKWFYDNRDLFDLSLLSVDQILTDPRWAELQRSWGDGTAPSVCYRICGVARGSQFADANAVHARDRTLVKLK